MRKLSRVRVDPWLVGELNEPHRLGLPTAVDWGSGSNRVDEFKEIMRSGLRSEQAGRCAYCGAPLIAADGDLEHIAKKSTHSQWTFWPLNLVLACVLCNRKLKGNRQVVVAVDRVYRRTKFSIVHPYLDDPPKHLRFFGSKRAVLVETVNNSAKGEATISFFQLADPVRCKQRIKDVIHDEDVLYLGADRWRLLFEAYIHAPKAAKRLEMKAR